MSKQGNYVTIPGVDPNWAKGISSALSDLSRSYNQRASEEAAAAERLAANEESKRRWEAEQTRMAAKDQYQRERDLLSDARAQEQQQIDVWRYNNQEDRAAAAERRAVAEAEFKQGERERAQTNRDVLGQLTVDFGADSLGPNVQSRIDQAREHIDTTRAAIDSNVAAINQRRSFLTPEGGFSDAGKAEYDARYGSYMEMYNDPVKAAELAKADVVTMRNNALTNDYETKARAELAAVETAFNNQLSRLGTQGTVEEFIAAGQAQAAAAGHLDPYSKELRDELRARAIDRGLKTRGDIIAAGQATAEAAYQKEKDRIGFMKDYYTASGKGTSSNNRSTGLSDEKFTDFITNIDLFGTSDRDRAISLLQTLKNDPTLKGVGDEFIREAIVLTGTKGLDEETLDPTNPKDLQTVATLAADLAKGNTTGSKYVDKKDFEINQDNLKSYSADELMGRRFDLQVPKTYITPREVLARPDVAAFKAKQAAEAVNPPTPTPPTPPVTKDEPLPTDGSLNVDKLKAMLGSQLDLEGPASIGPGPGKMRLERPYTPRETLSRDIIKTQTTIDELRSALADPDMGTSTRQLKQARLNKLLKERASLKDELYGLE